MQESLNVLILFEMKEEKQKELEKICPYANYIYCSGETVTDEYIENADIILGSLAPEKIEKAKKLKWMQIEWAGTDHIQKSGIFPENAILTNATGGYGLAISEHMLGMVFAISKKLNLYRDNQNQQLWQDLGTVLPVYGSTTVIIGLGDIGSEFAKRMKAMGSYIIGVRRENRAKPAYVDELYLNESIEDVIKRADILALAVPGTKDTKNILSKERIAMLKKNTILINVGRGSAVDTEALADALENGDIYGAGLDVTYPEPLPSDHRLWKMKNALITPHISGGYHLDETYRRIIEICIYNFDAYVNRKQMRNIVDFKRGY